MVNSLLEIISKCNKILMFDVAIDGEKHYANSTIAIGNKAVIANTDLSLISLSICY